MNLNIKKIFNCIKNNKFLILFLLIILIVLLNIKPIREGLTGSTEIGEYEYLAPNNTILSENIAKDFINKYNINSNYTSNLSYPIPDIYQSILFGDKPGPSDNEAKYYIQNGYFPYNNYIINYFNTKVKNNNALKNTAIVGINPITNPNALQEYQKRITCRSFYKFFILNDEEKLSPQPLSYQIFMGTAQPPSSSSSSSSSSLSTMSSLPSSTNSGNYYNDFISLCKKVNAST